MAAVLSAVLEKVAFSSQRGLFGVASIQNGQMVFYRQGADGKADTASGTAPQLGMNRQVARLAMVVGSVAAIEHSSSATAQYALLGVAALSLAHLMQDVFPQLGKL